MKSSVVSRTLVLLLMLLGCVAGKKIKHLADPEDNWTKIPGPPGVKMAYISFDGRTLAGTDDRNRIWAKTGKTGNWRLIEGELTQLIVLGSMIHGLDPNGRVLYGSTSNAFNGTWDSYEGITAGNLTHFHFDGVNIAALNSTGGIQFKLNDLQPSSDFPSNWTQLNLNLTWLTFFEDTAYGVDKKGRIYIGDTDEASAWKALEGNLTQIFYDGTKVVGINADNNNVCLAEKHLNDINSEDWIGLGGPMKQVEVFGNHVYGLYPGGGIYYLNLAIVKRTKYCYCQVDLKP